MRHILIALFSIITISLYSQSGIRDFQLLSDQSYDTLYVMTNDTNPESATYKYGYWRNARDLGSLFADQDWLKLNTTIVPTNADSAFRVGYTEYRGTNGGLPTKIAMTKEGYILFENTGLFSSTRYLLKANPLQTGASPFGITQLSVANGYGARNNETASIGINPLGSSDVIMDNWESHYRPSVGTAYWERHLVVLDTFGVARRVFSYTLDKGMQSWNVYTTVDSWTLRSPAYPDGPNYATLNHSNNTNTLFKLTGSATGESVGFTWNTTFDALQINPLDGAPSTSSVDMTNMRDVNMNIARIMNEWGTLHGSDGNASVILGKEQYYGGVVNVDLGSTLALTGGVLDVVTSAVSDQDWIKEGTASTVPTNTENMFHMGEVGIGTNAPAYALDVTGQQRIFNNQRPLLLNNTGYSLINFGDDAGTNKWDLGKNDIESFYLADATTGQTLFSSTLGSNFINVHGPTAAATGNSAANVLGMFRADNSGVAYGQRANMSLFRWEDDASCTALCARSGLTFSLTHSTSAVVDVLTLLSSGNIGVGTTNPIKPLHVVGEARITGTGGEATSLTGRDADSDITNVSLATGLTIVGGALTPADASAANEIQTLSAGGAATTYTLDLSASGGTVTLEEGTNFTIDRSGNTLTLNATGGVTDHGALTGLADDDHAQYALLAGRSSGQTLIGGTGTTDDLVLQTTSGVGASGADMIFQGGNNGATEFMRILNSGNVGVGVSPLTKLHVQATSEQLRLSYDASNYFSTTVNSTGFVTLNATGTNPAFTFSDKTFITASGANATGLVGTDASGFIASVGLGTGLSFSSGTINYTLPNADYGDITVTAGPIMNIDAGVVGTNEIATDGVDAAEIAAGAVGASELASTAVTPATYTLATITVDQDGRITSASNGTGTGDGNGIFDAANDGATVPTSFNIETTDWIDFEGGTFYIGGADQRIGIGTNSPDASSELTISDEDMASTTPTLEFETDQTAVASAIMGEILFSYGTDDLSKIEARKSNSSGATKDSEVGINLDITGGTSTRAVEFDYEEAYTIDLPRTRIYGGVQYRNVSDVSTTLTLDESYHNIRVTGNTGTITLTLVNATSTSGEFIGMEYHIYNDSAFDVTIDPGTSNDFINGSSASITLNTQENTTLRLMSTDASGVNRWTASYIP